MAKNVDWARAVTSLIKKYKGKTHPLHYKNTYQLLVMVVLSAQDSDKHINEVAIPFFKAFPTMTSLARADKQMLFKYLRTVRNFANKTKWLMKLAHTVKSDKNIPLTMEGLTALPGIGRKSANVIMRESGLKAEGIIVDLHVLRVVPRLGLATDSEDAKKMEKELMAVIPEKYWGEIGMAISFLGREICRPTDPKHEECVMKDVCTYYKSLKK